MWAYYYISHIKIAHFLFHTVLHDNTLPLSSPLCYDNIYIYIYIPQFAYRIVIHYQIDHVCWCFGFCCSNVINMVNNLYVLIITKSCVSHNTELKQLAKRYESTAIYVVCLYVYMFDVLFQLELWKSTETYYSYWYDWVWIIVQDIFYCFMFYIFMSSICIYEYPCMYQSITAFYFFWYWSAIKIVWYKHNQIQKKFMHDRYEYVTEWHIRYIPLNFTWYNSMDDRSTSSSISLYTNHDLYTMILMMMLIYHPLNCIM